MIALLLKMSLCNSWPSISRELWGVTVRALVCIFVDALAESVHSAVLDSSVADVILCVIAFSIVLSVLSFCVLIDLTRFASLYVSFFELPRSNTSR